MRPGVRAPSAPNARLVEFDDGVVVFDPLTWQTRTMPYEALDVFDWVADLMAQGVRDRDAIVAALLAEGLADADAGDTVEFDRATAVQALELWADLALNLYS